MRVLGLDVTDPESIAAAVAAAGPIDVLVNNAGIGALGAFEATPIATARELFETNTFGVMAMTQAVLPSSASAGRHRDQRHLERDAGADAAGRRLHRVEDRDRGLHGLAGARARGARRARQARRARLRPEHGFAANGQSRMDGLIPEPYAPFAQRVMADFQALDVFTRESDVAEAVWHAAHDTTGQLRFPAGRDAVALTQTALTDRRQRTVCATSAARDGLPLAAVLIIDQGDTMAHA